MSGDDLNLFLLFIIFLAVTTCVLQIAHPGLDLFHR